MYPLLHLVHRHAESAGPLGPSVHASRNPSFDLRTQSRCRAGSVVDCYGSLGRRNTIIAMVTIQNKRTFTINHQNSGNKQYIAIILGEAIGILLDPPWPLRNLESGFPGTRSCTSPPNLHLQTTNPTIRPNSVQVFPTAMKISGSLDDFR